MTVWADLPYNLRTLSELGAVECRARSDDGMGRNHNAPPRFAIIDLVVPQERDMDFRWALVTLNIKVISTIQAEGKARKYSLSVPDARALRNFIAVHLGPRVIAPDVDRFWKDHVRDVTPTAHAG